MKAGETGRETVPSADHMSSKSRVYILLLVIEKEEKII